MPKSKSISKEQKTFELKRIGVLSVAKIYSLIMLIFGLFLGIFFAVIGTLIPTSGKEDVFLSLGIFAAIVIPILYAIIGFIFGALTAVIYNLIAKLVGGIRFEVKK